MYLLFPFQCIQVYVFPSFFASCFPAFSSVSPLSFYVLLGLFPSFFLNFACLLEFWMLLDSFWICFSCLSTNKYYQLHQLCLLCLLLGRRVPCASLTCDIMKVLGLLGGFLGCENRLKKSQNTENVVLKLMACQWRARERSGRRHTPFDMNIPWQTNDNPISFNKFFSLKYQRTEMRMELFAGWNQMGLRYE